MDLRLDPASKQAGRMIDLVDKQLVFKPLNKGSERLCESASSG
jgi:hypothetical protein